MKLKKTIVHNNNNDGTVLAMINHELRTPLSVARLASEMILKKIDLHEEVPRRYVQTVIDELDMLSRTLSFTSDLSKIATHSFSLNLELIDLSELILNLIERMSHIHPTHTFSLNIDPSLSIHLDKFKIEQVFTNLLNNAIRFSPTGSTIFISLTAQEDNLVLSIQDEGPGISKKDFRAIFRLYFQASQRAKEGYGIGLYLAKEIIKRHKGKIWVSSTIGKGSTFFVSMPL